MGEGLDEWILLYSLWFPALVTALELVGFRGIQPWEWLFIAVAWPAAFPLTVSLLLLHRAAPFAAGFCAALCIDGVLVSELLEVALGLDYWRSTPSFFNIIAGAFFVFVKTAALALAVWLVLECCIRFLRWRRSRVPV